MPNPDFMKYKIHNGSWSLIQNLSTKGSKAEDYKASEYVRLEADFFTESYCSPTFEDSVETSRNRTILVISFPHPLLNGIVSELQNNLGDKVIVLIASDQQSVQTILNNKEVGLVLYTSKPDVIGGSSILKALQSDGNFSLKSTLILIRKSDPEIQSWIQNSLRSKHIMKTINQLNELT
jgi:hypothetical protein